MSMPKTSHRSVGDPEEEMRLYYVGVTRAKEELVVSSICTPSNFVDYTLRMKENIIDLGAFSGYMIENLKSEGNPNGYSLRDSMMSRDGLSNIAKKDYDVLQKRFKNKKIMRKKYHFSTTTIDESVGKVLLQNKQVKVLLEIL